MASDWRGVVADVDKIIVKEASGTRTLTAVQWKALPLTERVKLLSADVTFMAAGQKVSPKEAIAQLRK
jgi:hypothetical protein